ncbi:MAG: hypothetical protein ACP5J5_04530, partial [Dissulfurimicrobium sp.]
DPPYMEGLSNQCLGWVVHSSALRIGGIMAVEEFKKVELPQGFGMDNGDKALKLVDVRAYGQSRIWFYKRG